MTEVNLPHLVNPKFLNICIERMKRLDKLTITALVLTLIPLIFCTPLPRKVSEKTKSVNYNGTIFHINSTIYQCIKRLGKGEFGVTYLTNGTLPLVIKISSLTLAEEAERRRKFNL